MLVPVVIAVVSLSSAAFAKEYNCTADESLCLTNRANQVMLSGQRMCCPPFASLSINNNVCTCVEQDFPAEEMCLKGVPACREGVSFSHDGSQIQCCRARYMLKQINARCTCTPVQQGMGGGFMSSFMGMGGGMGNGGMSMVMSNGMPTNPATGQQMNATEIRDQWKQMGNAWRNWGRDFTQGFSQWGRNFGRHMHGTGMNLARSLSGTMQTALRNTVTPLQRAIDQSLQNVFRSIPRF